MIFQKYIYALFLGLFLLKEEVPPSLLDYIRKNPLDTDSKSLSIIFSSLANAPNLTDDLLRSMIIGTLD